MKQTATEYLFEKLWDSPKDKLTWHSILEQANKMFEQQIIEAYTKISMNTPQQYYKETYDK